MNVSSQAVVFRGAGGVEVIAVEPRAVRSPGPDELRIRVAAAGLNRADVMQRRGFYPAPAGVPADVPGLEYAGTVEATGGAVQGWAVGDRVMGIVAGGAMCEHVVVHAREALRVPPGLSLEAAAALPEAFLTAWDALVLQGGLRPSGLVLVHAAGSGVGTAAVQLSRALGASTVGTSRSEDKLARCGPLGMDHGILVSREGEVRFAEAVEQLAGRRADVIIDTVGAGYLAENVRALAPRGRLVCLGLLAGATGELPLALLLGKRARLVGSVLRSRPLEEKIALAQAFTREVLPLFAAGRLEPVVGGVWPIAEVAEAHRTMEADALFGKLVLRFG